MPIVLYPCSTEGCKETFRSRNERDVHHRFCQQTARCNYMDGPQVLKRTLSGFFYCPCGHSHRSAASMQKHARDAKHASCTDFGAYVDAVKSGAFSVAAQRKELGLSDGEAGAGSGGDSDDEFFDGGGSEVASDDSDGESDAASVADGAADMQVDEDGSFTPPEPTQVEDEEFGERHAQIINADLTRLGVDLRVVYHAIHSPKRDTIEWVLLVCCSCQHAIDGDAASALQHLRACHRDSTAGLDIKAFKAALNGVPFTPLKAITYPPPAVVIVAVPYVKVIDAGRWCKECLEVFISEDAAGRHKCSAVDGSERARIGASLVQKLQHKTAKSFRVVLSSGSALANPPAADAVKADVSRSDDETLFERFFLTHDAIAASAVAAAKLAGNFGAEETISPFLRTAGWRGFLQHVDLARAASLKALPARTQTGVWTAQHRIVAGVHQAALRARDRMAGKADGYGSVIGNPILNWLRSAKSDGPHRRTFTVSNATAFKNQTNWARYILAAHNAHVQPDIVPINFTDEQLDLLDALELAAADPDPEGPHVVSATLVDAITAFSVALLMQELPPTPINHPLLQLNALVCIDEATASIPREGSLAAIYSSSMWALRLFYWDATVRSAKLEKLSYAQWRADFKAGRLDWMVAGCDAPAAILLQLLGFAKKASVAEGTKFVHRVSADRESVFVNGADEVKVADLGKMMRGLTDEIEARLVALLGTLPDVDVGALSDRLDVAIPWHNFASERANVDGAYASTGGRPLLLTRLIQDLNLRTEAFEGDDDLRFSGAFMRRFHLSHQELLEFIALASYLQAGSPPRETEKFTTEVVNPPGGGLRSLILRDSLLMDVGGYNKINDATGHETKIARFWPPRLTTLFVIYVLHVRPVYVNMVQQQLGRPPSTLLYSKPDGSAWPQGTLTRLLQRETGKALGLPIGIRTWRQLSTFLRNMFILPGAASKDRAVKAEGAADGAEVGDGADDGDDDDDDEADEDADDEAAGHEAADRAAFAAQMGHSLETDRRNYGVEMTSLATLTDENVIVFARASKAWHRLFRLEPSSSALVKVEPALEEAKPQVPSGGPAPASALPTLGDRLVAAPPAITVGPQVNLVAPSSNGQPHSPELLAAMNLLMHRQGKPDWRMATKEQGRALDWAFEGQRTIIYVSATGSGKSTLWEAVSMTPGGHGIVVIAPFRALVQDLLYQMNAKGIDAKPWSSGSVGGQAQVWVVSADIAAKPVFLTWAKRGVIDGSVKTVVHDEGHIPAFQLDFRQTLSQLRALSSLGVKLWFTTATLPPSAVDRLKRTLMLVEPVCIARGPTYKANHRLSVAIAPEPASAQEWMVEQIVEGLTGLDGGKALIFVLTVAEGKTLAKHLGLPFYHGQLPELEKDALDNQWRRNNDFPAMIATSAFTHGVHSPSVRVVWHVGAPRLCWEFIQMAGRCGRDGEVGDVCVLLKEPVGDLLPSATDEDATAMHDHLEGRLCRRYPLAYYNDGEGVECRSIAGSVLCDVCTTTLLPTAPVHNQGAAVASKKRERPALSPVKPMTGAPRLLPQRHDMASPEKQRIRPSPMTTASGEASTSAVTIPRQPEVFKTPALPSHVVAATRVQRDLRSHLQPPSSSPWGQGNGSISPDVFVQHSAASSVAGPSRSVLRPVSAWQPSVSPSISMDSVATAGSGAPVRRYVGTPRPPFAGPTHSGPHASPFGASPASAWSSSRTTPLQQTARSEAHQWEIFWHRLSVFSVGGACPICFVFESPHSPGLPLTAHSVHTCPSGRSGQWMAYRKKTWLRSSVICFGCWLPLHYCRQLVDRDLSNSIAEQKITCEHKDVVVPIAWALNERANTLDDVDWLDVPMAERSRKIWDWRRDQHMVAGVEANVVTYLAFLLLTQSQADFN